MNMRTGIKRSCDVYFYEVARRLGVDRLSETAKKFGLGKKVLQDFFEERSGVVPNTTWKKKLVPSRSRKSRSKTEKQNKSIQT